MGSGHKAVGMEGIIRDAQSEAEQCEHDALKVVESFNKSKRMKVSVHTS